MELLRVQDISKRYGKTNAVCNVNFNVREGEIFGLLGPNGAGKSTLISMISSLFQPDKGDIIYREESILKNSKIMQTELGYVPQEIALYHSLTGRENLYFWGKINGATKFDLNNSVKEVIDLIGMEDRIDDKVSTYSGGMKRRLNIGVALLHSPRLIILDEPTVGIDPQSRNHVLETIKKLNKEKGVTVIYSSHYINEVEELCDRICIMDRGEIVAIGAFNELLELCHLETCIQFSVTESEKEIIQRLEQLNGIHLVKNENGQILAFGMDSMRFVEDIIMQVHQCNAKILSIETKRPDLESVFFSLTNKKLRD